VRARIPGAPRLPLPRESGKGKLPKRTPGGSWCITQRKSWARRKKGDALRLFRPQGIGYSLYLKSKKKEKDRKNGV